MKAWVLRGVNDLRLEDVREPILSNKEVMVDVKAVGICGSDIPRIYQTGAYSYPLIPGHEFSGIVTEVGKQASASWNGKRVGIFPLIPCGKCIPCQNRQFEMCRNYSYLGSRRDGGFAEYVAVPEKNLICLPRQVSFEAAAMLEPMAVAVHAIRRAMLQKTDTVAICGLGTIGLFVFMFLKEAGVSNVLLIGKKESQKRMVMEMGAADIAYCDSRAVDVKKWIGEKTEGTGVNLFFECTGRNEVLNQAINSTAPGGRILLVGNPCSDMWLEREVYWKVLRNQMTITGTWNSAFLHKENDDWKYVLECLSKGRIFPEKLISHKFSMEELEEGFHIMRDKAEDYIKIMGIR